MTRQVVSDAAATVRDQTDPAGVQNPYWDTARTIPGSTDYDHPWAPNGFAGPGGPSINRHALVSRYSWAITDPATVAFVATHSSGCSVVEIGAGTGYWAWQLTQRGVHVIAYDQAPPDQAPNQWHQPPPTGGAVDTFHPVIRGGPAQAAAYPDRVLFLCWPPYDQPLAADALAAYPGDTLIYIGEGDGGCTADDRFHRALADGWDVTAKHRPARWWGLHDWVTVYRRSGSPSTPRAVANGCKLPIVGPGLDLPEGMIP